MKYKKIYEFLVWDNCNNHCKFCWQRKNPRIYDNEKRASILNEVLVFLRSEIYEYGSHILVCGGEIFDKPSDFKVLDLFFDKIIEMMKEGRIDLLYINTNLIHEDSSGIFNFLDKIKNAKLFNRLKFTTSYDIYGRFKTENDRNLMLSNLHSITENYKDIKIVTNTILTKQTCESILSNKFNPKEFMSNYNCWINFIPYIVLDKELMPTRSQVFTTLLNVDKLCEGYLEKYIPNMSITQEKHLYLYQDNKFKFCSSNISKCGHSENFKRYSEDGTCFCCDLKEVLDGEI